MGEFEPIIKRADCGDGYGVAFVKRTTGSPAVTTQMEVRVDLNKDDGTADPRVILADGTSVTVDAGFVAKYQAMKDGHSLGGEAREKACKALKPKDPYVSPWLITVPVLTTAGSLFLDAKFDRSLMGVPGFATDGMSNTLFGFSQGFKLGTTVTRTWVEPRLDPTWGWVATGLFGGTGLISGGLTLGGIGGDATADLAIRSLTDTGLVQVYRYGGEWAGGGTEMAIGLAYFLIGWKGMSKPSAGKIPESQIYVNGTVSDPYNVSGNPYPGASSHPRLRDNLMWGGGAYMVDGALHLFLKSIGVDTDAHHVRVSPELGPDGGSILVTGSF